MAEGSAAGFGTFSARKEALNRLERALEKFPPLLKRTFISCESEEEVSDVRTSEFRVMQWNVLADGKTFTCSSLADFIEVNLNYRENKFILSLLVFSMIKYIFFLCSS